VVARRSVLPEEDDVVGRTAYSARGHLGQVVPPALEPVGSVLTTVLLALESVGSVPTAVPPTAGIKGI
jgi:hypothetical protein